MATSSRKPHPLRTLLIFLTAIALMYGLMAIARAWTPKLGLDLQGGMTITLTATNSTVDATSLELAKDIIQQRVDAMGVGEASVAVSGDRHIVVSAPNVKRDDLVDLVGATAQLAFRPVLNASQADAPMPSPTATPTGPGLPTQPPAKTDDGDPGKRLPSAEVLAYQPTEADNAAFAAFKCGDPVVDKLDKPLIACDENGVSKYLLAPVAIVGEELTNASSGIPQGNVKFAVTLDLNDQGGKELADMWRSLSAQQNPRNLFAIVLDGKVVEAASMSPDQPILTGRALIQGNFTAESAAQLANVLKFGSLPLSFEPSQVENVSATLGGAQLRVGLIAGLIGLLVVIAYCLAYYRGLGLVVIGSLAVAALATYASMVLLGQAVGFALSLPAIAGAIVAIGVTADSFVIYFERIRDEIREGRSLRSALETGWIKARPTIVVADLVSILSAVVLYVLAVGGVKGFAFALGLTTVIDLAVCFFFTKPLVSLLGRTKFFGEGHKWSGLDAAHMGVSRDSLLGRRIRRTTPIAKEA